MLSRSWTLDKMDMPKKQLVAEAMIDLHGRLNTLPTRSHERRMIMQETANLYGVSVYPNRVSIEHSAKGASKGVAALRSWLRRRILKSPLSPKDGKAHCGT